MFRNISLRSVAIIAALLVIAAACSSTATPSETAAPVPEATVVEQSSSTTSNAPATTEPIELPDHAGQLQLVQDAATDSGLPPQPPDQPVGVYGFSRYVYSQIGDVVAPVLVEGPRGEQLRCQDDEQVCSYLELKALYESGDEVPDYLSMSRDELGSLVGELDQTSAYLQSFESTSEICAAGYIEQSTQNPNMGIHMVNSGLVGDGFDPDRPEIILLAKDGGEQLLRSEQGRCSDGEWVGEDGYQVVGAAFMEPLADDHPEGFTGQIDNWHVHYNTCAGGEDEAKAVGSQADCEAEGGSFSEVIPVWMMHAYVAPEFDSAQGVFAMFNGSIWPTVDAGVTFTRFDNLPEDAIAAPIVDFDFGLIKAGVGESVVFSNGDGVAHTVSAGTPARPTGAFDSGVLGAGGAWTTSFDEPGTYPLYCALHPQMTGTVVVE